MLPNKVGSAGANWSATAKKREKFDNTDEHENGTNSYGSGQLTERRYEEEYLEGL
jgi:hypothetical protein